MYLSRKAISVCAFIAVFADGALTQAQTLSSTYRVADINPGSVGSFPSNMAVFANSLYFGAYTFNTGRELWKYVGNTIVLATNINDTADDIGGGLLEGNDSVPQG